MILLKVQKNHKHQVGAGVIRSGLSCFLSLFVKDCLFSFFLEKQNRGIIKSRGKRIYAVKDLITGRDDSPALARRVLCNPERTPFLKGYKHEIFCLKNDADQKTKTGVVTPVERNPEVTP